MVLVTMFFLYIFFFSVGPADIVFIKQKKYVLNRTINIERYKLGWIFE